MKKLMATMIATAVFTAAAPVALAADQFGLSPAACEEAVAYYMDQRLTDPRAARYQLASDPYKVVVNLRGSGEITAWAVDVRVKSRLPSGSWSSFQPYTVIFQNGQAVALESDLRSMLRV